MRDVHMSRHMSKNLQGCIRFPNFKGRCPEVSKTLRFAPIVIWRGKALGNGWANNMTYMCKPLPVELFNRVASLDARALRSGVGSKDFTIGPKGVHPDGRPLILIYRNKIPISSEPDTTNQILSWLIKIRLT